MSMSTRRIPPLMETNHSFEPYVKLEPQACLTAWFTSHRYKGGTNSTISRL